jgi:hypothetical protein
MTLAPVIHFHLGVNFINIFGEKRIAKSAKLPVNCKKIRTLCAENRTLCAKIKTLCRKQLFCHSREKAAHKYVVEIDAWSNI